MQNSDSSPEKKFSIILKHPVLNALSMPSQKLRIRIRIRLYFSFKCGKYQEMTKRHMIFQEKIYTKPHIQGLVALCCSMLHLETCLTVMLCQYLSTACYVCHITFIKTGTNLSLGSPHANYTAHYPAIYRAGKIYCFFY